MINGNERTFSFFLGNRKHKRSDAGPLCPNNLFSLCPCVYVCQWKVNGSPRAVCNNQCVLGRWYRGGGKWIR